MDTQEHYRFLQLDTSSQLSESDHVWRYRLSLLQDLVNPPDRVVIFCIAAVMLTISLSIRIISWLYISAIIIIIQLIFLLVKFSRFKKIDRVVAIKQNLIGVGTEKYMDWFKREDFSKLTFSFGKFKVLHLSTGHQFIIPINVLEDKNFNKNNISI